MSFNILATDSCILSSVFLTSSPSNQLTNQDIQLNLDITRILYHKIKKNKGKK